MSKRFRIFFKGQINLAGTSPFWSFYGLSVAFLIPKSAFRVHKTMSDWANNLMEPVNSWSWKVKHFDVNGSNCFCVNWPWRKYVRSAVLLLEEMHPCQQYKEQGFLQRIRNHMRIVFEEMSSWTALTMNLGMKTKFYTKYIYSKCVRTFITRI